MHDEFIRILKEHTARYPKMEKQDYGKLVFQSEYGPEHLVTEKESVLSFLQEEMAELPSDAAPPNIEPFSSVFLQIRDRSGNVSRIVSSDSTGIQPGFRRNFG